MFVLLRHAHAISKQSWHGSDAHRPLSALGKEQAAGLVGTLTGVELRVLYCSPTTRCLATGDVAGPRWCTHGETLTALSACTRPDGTHALSIGPTAKGGAWLLSAHTPLRCIDPRSATVVTRQ
ncbi:phosphoglycerate mutase family protein [Rhodococcus sp. WS4]|nr:phosphoglycerate mutase family protein [Rhodococcus sp. WS4]